MKRKVLALLLGVSMVAAATSGCGSKKAETEAPATEAATEAAAETETEAATEAETEASATEAESETEASTEAETEAATEAESETEASTEAETEVVTEVQTEEATEAETETETEEATEAETEEVTEAETETETEEETETETETETEEVTEVETETETEEVTEAETETETEEATENETETETEEETEAETETETEEVTEVETEMETEEETEAETETETEEVTEVETETETEEVTEAETETETETEEVTEAEEETETEAVMENSVTEAETETETEEVTEAETETETETEEVTEAETETETETEEATEAETETETETEEVTEAETETETETEEVTEAETETETETEEVTEAETETETETEAAVDYTVTISDGSGKTGTLEDLDVTADDIVVIYTNDVHGGISADEDYSGSADSLGYAGLAAVKDEIMSTTDQVTTVDLGDAIQGSVVCTESDGQDAIELMSMIGYDICIPGNHEFDYGMEAFLDYAENSDANFLSCNFIDEESGESVFDGYEIVTYEVNGQEFNVGYVGISTPETIAKSTPTYFQDEDGNYIYGFSADTPEELYTTVQNAVDAAIEDGADCVVALSHLGDQGVESDWSSLSVAANTTGIDVILDAHSHSTIPGETITNMDGEDVLLTSTGTKLENIGVLTLSVDGNGEVTASSGLVDELTDEEMNSEAYTEMDETVKGIEEQYAYLFEKVGSSDFALVINDPEDTENRLVRKTETNMGDFLTDAYREYTGADIAFLNGGSIRADISEGDIVYMDIITVLPWNSELGVIEATGQQILDCLEMGAHLYPEECGGFIQTSGLTYSIDTTIPSSVNVNSDGEFVSVDGDYRVTDVMVGNEPLDLEKTYTLAINDYYSIECGDGMTMFKGCERILPEEGEDPIVDHDVITAYLDTLGGQVPDDYENPYGQGRITLITEEEMQTATSNTTEKETEVTTEAETETETETEAETEEETESEVETEELTEAQTEAETETEMESETDTQMEAV